MHYWIHMRAVYRIIAIISINTRANLNSGNLAAKRCYDTGNMEGFKPSKNNEKKTPNQVPEIESTLQELEVRKAHLPEDEKVPGDLTSTQEQELKDTLDTLLEK